MESQRELQIVFAMAELESFKDPSFCLAGQ
jgi:hypothetical protein